LKSELNQSLSVLIDLADLKKNGLYVAMQALNAIDALDDKAVSLKGRIAALSRTDKSINPRLTKYATRLIVKILSDFKCDTLSRKKIVPADK